MAKRVDPAKAKAAKQKKMAIGLCVMLVLVLAVQGPKTLKMLKGAPTPSLADAPPGTAVPAGQAAPPTAATPATPTPTATPAPATAAGGVTGTSTEPQAAVLADSDAGVVAEEGQLLSFEQFESKDPFKQQAGDVVPAPGADVPAAAPNPTPAGTTIVAGSPPPTASGGGITGAPSGTPAVTSTTPAAASAPPAAPAASTTILVNGEVATVVADTPFPEAEPTFELVSVAADGKSVQIGIAGGQLSGSSPTVKLVLGKKLTLQNTADGSRYELQLLTVAGFVTPAPTKK